jgi:hypothetical protein
MMRGLIITVLANNLDLLNIIVIRIWAVATLVGRTYVAGLLRSCLLGLKIVGIVEEKCKGEKSAKMG